MLTVRDYCVSVKNEMLQMKIIVLPVCCSHECASGYYRVSAYFLSEVFCQLIPMRLIPLCFFSLIIYFMIGLLLPAF